MNAHTPENTPHKGDKHDAGTGQGTVSQSPEGETLERPVLDGSTEGKESEREVDNPWRGLEDPALIRHPDKGEKSENPYGG